MLARRFYPNACTNSSMARSSCIAGSRIVQAPRAKSYFLANASSAGSMIGEERSELDNILAESSKVSTDAAPILDVTIRRGGARRVKGANCRSAIEIHFSITASRFSDLLVWPRQGLDNHRNQEFLCSLPLSVVPLHELTSRKSSDGRADQLLPPNSSISPLFSFD